ncbi:hypothetical protein HDU76_007610 [Blyttiomyces sp. JEL0837]|nr:hypothetical protein HDU76_007610 [Blyttiomyces sp. JEL0837]
MESSNNYNFINNSNNLSSSSSSTLHLQDDDLFSLSELALPLPLPVHQLDSFQSLITTPTSASTSNTTSATSQRRTRNQHQQRTRKTTPTRTSPYSYPTNTSTGTTSDSIPGSPDGSSSDGDSFEFDGDHDMHLNDTTGSGSKSTSVSLTKAGLPRKRDPAEREARKQARAVRNRIAAQVSRDRKKKEMEELQSTNDILQQKLTEMASEKQELVSRIDSLAAVVTAMHSQLATLTSNMNPSSTSTSSMNNTSPVQPSPSIHTTSPLLDLSSTLTFNDFPLFDTTSSTSTPRSTTHQHQHQQSYNPTHPSPSDLALFNTAFPEILSSPSPSTSTSTVQQQQQQQQQNILNPCEPAVLAPNPKSGDDDNGHFLSLPKVIKDPFILLSSPLCPTRPQVHHHDRYIKLSSLSPSPSPSPAPIPKRSTKDTTIRLWNPEAEIEIDVVETTDSEERMFCEREGQRQEWWEMFRFEDDSQQGGESPEATSTATTTAEFVNTCFGSGFEFQGQAGSGLVDEVGQGDGFGVEGLGNVFDELIGGGVGQVGAGAGVFDVQEWVKGLLLSV